MATPTHRKTPSRAALPRRTTRGPLDQDDDPLSATLSPSSTLSPLSPSSRDSTLGSSPVKAQDINPFDQQDLSTSLKADVANLSPKSEDDQKNLSFLLEGAIYHPLGQVDVPPPFRKAFLPPPPTGTSIEQALGQMDALIAECDFLGAGHFAAMCLTSGLVSPTDHTSIFRLLAVRYSSLELLGQVLLAAQESKALEDVSSEFYYIETQNTTSETTLSHNRKSPSRHIMPFSLRIQALRLQSIGFSDPRRGITALYDLGFEVRQHLAYSDLTDKEKSQWTERLELIGIHVINSLIELGDLDCALRTLAQSRPMHKSSEARWAARMILLHAKLGQLTKARSLIDTMDLATGEKAILSSMIAVADGNLDQAISLLESYGKQEDDHNLKALAKQNLAISYLYLGNIKKASQLLEDVVKDGYSFQSLTINLATIYDLTSDRSRELKLGLANRLATSNTRIKAFTNADFKL